MAVAPILSILLVLPLVTVSVGTEDLLAPTTREMAARGDWPPLAEALLRPGALVTTTSGQCTANFVFEDATQSMRYLGVAATCVRDMTLGEMVFLEGGATGRLAYSAWLALDAMGDTSLAARERNDFALVLVDEAFHDLVHPAVRGFGGPVALAEANDVAVGERVMSVGAAPLRPSELHARDGLLLERGDDTSAILLLTPGIMGDMGSPVLTADGRAFGILTTLGVTPAPGANQVVNLAGALRFASEHGGPAVQLATWELLDAGLLPLDVL